MRINRDKKSENELEIDDFLSKFETPVEDISADVNSYLDSSSDKSDSFTWDEKAPTPSKGNNASSKGELVSKNSGLASEKTLSSKERMKKRKESEEAYRKLRQKDSRKSVDSYLDSTRTNKTNKEYNSQKKEKPSDSKKKISISDKKLVQDIKSQANIDTVSKATVIDFLFMKDNPDYDPTKGDVVIVAGKKVKNTPKTFSIKKLIRDGICAFAGIVVCFMIYALVCIAFAPSVSVDKLYSYIDQSSIIYDDDDKQVDSVYYTQNRKITKYKDMPEDLVNAFVAIEDKTFWKHHGFNWKRMIGAVVSSVVGGGRISGTSTITQQLARNVYLADTKSVRSIKRKVLEMYYAARIESVMSKEEIIEAYLNTIYLGYGCYGVDAAAKSYFSKSVKDLTPVECAALAALPQAPEEYALVKYGDSDTVARPTTKVITTDPDTYVSDDVSKERRDLTLDLMKEQGYLTDAEYNKYHGMDLADFIKPTISNGHGAYSYYHEYLVDTVINDLMEEYDMEYSDAERMVYTQGLKIYSTMDSTAQEVIVKEFQNNANFPSVSGAYQTDSNGNIVNSDGTTLLYKFENFFDDSGNFTLSGKKQVSINKDGSVTVKDNNRLNVYTTEVTEGTDYSLEFKHTYKIIDGVLYSYAGGYINVPIDYKSLDSDGNLVISSQFFKDYPNLAKKVKAEDGGDDSVVFTASAYSLAQKTVQPQAAMVVVGVGTGEVKAMVGGRTTKGEKLLNRALNARQPGSSIKPLSVYGAALQKSYDLAAKGKKWTYTDFGIDKQGIKGYGDYITTYSSVEDEKCYVEGRMWPKNASGGFSGKNTFMTAIQQSINTCAVKIQLQIGAEYSADMLEKFGLSTVVTDESNANNDMNPSALALGGMVNGVIPLEMALAYASFPAGGQLNTPICYTKVVDADGKVLLESKSEQSKTMDEGVAWIMTEVLKTVVSKGIAGSAYVTGTQSGGKTGTTNDKYDIWFDGFTPKYAASLWIGTDDNITMSTMSGPAAALWGKIMRQIPKAAKGKYKIKPANVVYKNGCYFTKGTENGLDHYSGNAEEEAKKVAAVEAYFLTHECTIEEACRACGITFAEYKEYGGTIKAGTKSDFVEEPEEPVDPTPVDPPVDPQPTDPPTEDTTQ